MAICRELVNRVPYEEKECGKPATIYHPGIGHVCTTHFTALKVALYGWEVDKGGVVMDSDGIEQGKLTPEQEMVVHEWGLVHR